MVDATRSFIQGSASREAEGQAAEVCEYDEDMDVQHPTQEAIQPRLLHSSRDTLPKIPSEAVTANASMSPGALQSLAAELKRQAHALGFELSGICPAVTPQGAMTHFREWLAAGYAGEMTYLQERLPAYEDPNLVLEGVRSIVMLAFPYRTAEPRPAEPGQGRVARYAWGEADYHDLLHERLKKLVAWLKDRAPQAKARGVVDSAPVLEREFAQLARLGWIGKNTLLLNRTLGSYFFLAAMLTDLDLPADEPSTVDHCGTCTACLDACPTQAFVQPRVLDATRCISYLTIEHRGPLPTDLRPGIGDWLFGCDVCQDVCPWNRKAPATQTSELAPRDDSNPIDLLPLFDLTDEDFRARFRRTPLWRAKRRGLLRNAAIILGNQRFAPALARLRRAAEEETDELLRATCRWAVKQIERALP
jgi:epoxyqueuosine reductase